MLVTPYYNKTTQKGLVKHFTMVANSVNLPIILYSVPSRTGVNIAPQTVKKLSEVENIVGIKEASGNISQVAKIAELCGDDFTIYSGNDDQIVPIMSLGGKGVISVLSNVAPKLTHEIAQLCLDNNCAEAAKLAAKTLHLANALFIDVNPIPVKAALNMMEIDAGPCRLPLYEMEDAKKEALAAALREAGLIK